VINNNGNKYVTTWGKTDTKTCTRSTVSTTTWIYENIIGSNRICHACQREVTLFHDVIIDNAEEEH